MTGQLADRRSDGHTNDMECLPSVGVIIAISRYGTRLFRPANDCKIFLRRVAQAFDLAGSTDTVGATALIRNGNQPGTTMISKSQEETEVSLHSEDWGLEAKVVRLG